MQTIYNHFINSIVMPLRTPAPVHKTRSGHNVDIVKSFPIVSLLLCFSLLFLHPLCLNAMQPIRIGTGGSTGVYYPIGKLIAQGLTLKATEESSVLNGHIGVAQNSAGSIANTDGVINGEIEIGMVQADIAAFAYNGSRTFKDLSDSSTIRAIASLYPEKFQIVVRKDAGIQTFNDLEGKKISVDEQGSGTLSVMQIILEAHGMTESDLEPQYLKPIFTRENMKDGRLHGFVMMAGAPMDAVTKLCETGINLVPIEPSIASNINKQFPYLYPGKIDANVYSGVPETPTVEVHSLLIVNDTMSDDLAYAITEMLFNKKTSSLLRDGHPQGKDITLASALEGVSIPLHPGAKRFYQEHNILK